MPALIVYLLKANIALLVFFTVYHFRLRRLTFYYLNRAFLVFGLIFSTVYPLINFSSPVITHAVLNTQMAAIIPNWQVVGRVTVVKSAAAFDYWQIAVWIFWTGVFVSMLRMVTQLYSIFKIYRNSKPALLHNYRVRLTTGTNGPFSFIRSIYINPVNLEAEELKAVLLHEQVHINERHTLDILLAEISCAFYWFNPCVWLIKNAIRENLEYITDRKVLQHGADTRQYQYSLLNICLASTTRNIAMHFNISTIKKRIIMMNRENSPNLKLTRYIVMLPLVITLLLAFTLSKAALKEHVLQNNVTTAKIRDLSYKPLLSSSHENITAKSKKPSPSSDKSKIARDTVIKKNDTIKTIRANFISTTYSVADSINYVIDGAKSTIDEAMAIDGSQIEEMLVLCPAYSNLLLGLPGKKQTLVIITKINKDAILNKGLEDSLGKIDPAKVNIQQITLSNGDKTTNYKLPNNINFISNTPVRAKLLDGTIVNVDSRPTNN